VLWFVESAGNKIGRITTAGVVGSEFSIPTGGSAPLGLAAGPDGALWFTEQNGDKIGRITTGGSISETAAS
jgi:virginiamycin B lyase